jgi:mevalonate kinase
MMQQTYTANGKLLISGEYLVMKGAKAFALPTKLGQTMTIVPVSGKRRLHWKSIDPSGVWFEASFDISDFKLLWSTNQTIAETLQRILNTAVQLNPGCQLPEEGASVETKLGFDRFWGLGSSSSLVYLVSQWLGCSPFELNRIVFNGSGYDIACAMSDQPIVYKQIDGMPQWSAVPFSPPFSDRLWLVYLNQKQNTQSELSRITMENVYTAEIELLDKITTQMIQSVSIEKWIHLIDRHEAIVGSVIQREPVKQILFSDFKGAVKSLGAWGGDFILAASLYSADETRNYFVDRGYQSIFPLKEFIW